MANNGNEVVLKGLNQFCLETAVQIYNINQIFDCEKVAIGGGISAQPLLLELIKRTLMKSIIHVMQAHYHQKS